MVDSRLQLLDGADIDTRLFVVRMQLLVGLFDELTQALIPTEDGGKVNGVGQGGIDLRGDLDAPLIIREQLLYFIGDGVFGTRETS